MGMNWIRQMNNSVSSRAVHRRDDKERKTINAEKSTAMFVSPEGVLVQADELVLA